MRRHALFLMLFLLLSGGALATTQEMSLLLFEGRHLWTYELPGLDEAFPGITFPDFRMISTANYKGYRAAWATFQKRLHLVGLEARVPGEDDLLRNEEVTPGHFFPLAVTNWSGSIVHTDESSSLDIETMSWTDITVTTTITISNGLVTATNVSVEKEPRNEDGEQAESTVPSKAAPSASSDVR